MCFVPFPGLNSSGDQVLGEHTVPGGPCILFTSPVPGAEFPWCTTRAPSQVCRVSPLGSCSQAVTFLADVNCPGSLEDVVSNREPAHSLVKDASLGSKLEQCLAFQLWLLLACLSDSGGGSGLYAVTSTALVFAQSFVL